MAKPERPPPPEDFDENPELTEEFFARARRGTPWIWQKQAETLLAVAKDLRNQADLLEREAKEIAGEDLGKAS